VIVLNGNVPWKNINGRHTPDRPLRRPFARLRGLPDSGADRPSRHRLPPCAGTEIVDGQDRPVILRGMGLGGWVLQEGYMLQLPELGQQHVIRARIAA
jgi:hypothetical protein